MLKIKKSLTALRSPLAANSGFTLIELLVVISVIGMLASLVLVNFNAARERARDTKRKTDLDQIKKSLRLYYNDYDQYPSSSGGAIVGCGSPPSACTWGENWSNGITFMKVLPQDPLYDSSTGTPTYSYQEYGSAPYQDFCLWATLENASDADISESQSRCGSAGCNGISLGASDYAVCAD